MFCGMIRSLEGMPSKDTDAPSWKSILSLLHTKSVFQFHWVGREKGNTFSI